MQNFITIDRTCQTLSRKKEGGCINWRLIMKNSLYLKWLKTRSKYFPNFFTQRHATFFHIYSNWPGRLNYFERGLQNWRKSRVCSTMAGAKILQSFKIILSSMVSNVFPACRASWRDKTYLFVHFINMLGSVKLTKKPLNSKDQSIVYVRRQGHSEASNERRHNSYNPHRSKSNFTNIHRSQGGQEPFWPGQETKVSWPKVSWPGPIK